MINRLTTIPALLARSSLALTLGLGLGLGLTASSSRAADVAAGATSSPPRPTIADGDATELSSITLTNGSVVTGELLVRDRGIYLKNETGGMLYAWAQIDPASLADDVRDTVRGQALDHLQVGQALYDGLQIDAARPHFEAMIVLQRYLTAEDRALPALQDLAYKRRGLLLYEGKWMTLAARKAKDGLYLSDGRWMTRDQIAEANAFRAAIGKARTADPADAIIAIKSAMATYPTSIYNDVAQQLLNRLVNTAVAPAPTPAPDVPAAVMPEPGRVEAVAPARYVPDRTGLAERDRDASIERQQQARVRAPRRSGGSSFSSGTYRIVDGVRYYSGSSIGYGSSGGVYYSSSTYGGYPWYGGTVRRPATPTWCYGLNLGGINAVYCQPTMPTFRFNF